MTIPVRVRDRASGIPAPVHVASAASVAIASFFILVWSPHPWGWEGFDHYHDLGLLLARGGAFPTTDVPWGYAYFLAPFYRLFGDRPWIPLLAQAALNGLVPILLYRLVALEFDRRSAVVAAVLAGFLSFNTVYASTQSSDAVCTVLFLAGLLAFAEGRGRIAAFAAAGALLGVAAQFRPNLVMLPPALGAAYLLTRPRNRKKIVQVAACLAGAAVVLMPWTIRNYRLLGLVLPTSTHGGVQWWYGTLQSGPYLKSRVYNPRNAFEFSAFDYSSAAGRPLLVTADIPHCAPPSPGSIALVYWTDRQPEPVRLAPARAGAREFAWQVPGQPIPTVLYYFVDAQWAPNEETPSGLAARLPEGGANRPAIHFISDAHLDDLDVHGDLLDVFDVIRIVRGFAWREPLPDADRLDLDGDGRISEADVRQAVDVLLRSRTGLLFPEGAVDTLRVDDTRAVITLKDRSTLTVPRAFSGRLSDIVSEGEYSRALVRAAVPFWKIPELVGATPADDRTCHALRNLAVNRAFHLAEPDAMRRYTALAWDNIRRDPTAYLASCAYRAWRLFIVQGTEDRSTTYQYRGSRLVYTAGTVLSVTYLILLAAGVVLAVRQHRPVLVLGAPILYVPLTIAWFLTNMRYTVTVQPLVFAFIALVLVALFDRARNGRARRLSPDSYSQSRERSRSASATDGDVAVRRTY